MSDRSNAVDYKALLKTAENAIVSLQEENSALKADLESMIVAQGHETEQMVQMSEQLWKLEEALLEVTSEKETAMMLLKSLKNNVDRIQHYAENTLKSVREHKASRLTMAAQVYEIKSLADSLNLKEIE